MKKIIRTGTEFLSTLSRKVEPFANADVVNKVQHLKEHGFVVLDHLVGNGQFQRIQKAVSSKIEHDLDFEYPCLAQTKINKIEHKDLIDNEFLADAQMLEQQKLTFHSADVKNYQQLLVDYRPSTLKVPMPSESDFYQLWLDPLVCSIVSSYMGFYPYLVEAYIRRNFPCEFRVMNHYWHRDRNHHKYLVKAFIFFTDCDIDTGAHHYIAKSINDPRFRNKNYYSDNEINSVWPIGSADHMISRVPAGTIVIEDTRGLHKAGVPSRDFRDLGFAVFMPPNFFKPFNSFYELDEQTFNNLSEQQRLFVPIKNVI